MRVLAALAAIGLLFVATCNLWFILFGAAILLSPPDPNTDAFEPCCAEPDMAAALAHGLAWWLGFVIVEGLILAIVAGLGCVTVRGRWPAWRRLALVPVATVLLAVALFAIPLLPLLDEGWKLQP